MPTSRAPLDKACADRRCCGGGNNTDGPSSPSFYIIFKVRPSAPSPKLVRTTPSDHRAPVLSQAAGALLSSCTSYRASTLTRGEAPQARAALHLNAVKHGVPEELKSSRRRAVQGCCSGAQAADLAAGTPLAGPGDVVVCRVRCDSRGCRVGFWPSAHLRGVSLGHRHTQYL